MIRNLEDCIDLIKRQNELDDFSNQDINELLELLRPYLSKKYGRNVIRQVESLINQKQFERTISFLNSLPKKRVSFKFKKRLYKAYILTFLIGVGIFCIYMGYYNITNSKASESWPSTKGVIIKSVVVKTESAEHNGRTYSARIEYKYIVEYKEYISDKVSFLNTDRPTTKVKKYPVGKEVDVFYNPENPEISVLEPGYSPLLYLWFVGAIISFFFAYYFIRFRKV